MIVIVILENQWEIAKKIFLNGNNAILIDRIDYEQNKEYLPNVFTIINDDSEKQLLIRTLNENEDNYDNIFILCFNNLNKDFLDFAEKIYILDPNKTLSFDDYINKTINFEDFIINEYTKISEEREYLNLVQQIIEKGNLKDNRTGIKTKSLFGCSLRFKIDKHFPLFTTKKMFWRGIVEELMWFLSGSTDVKKLQEKNDHIWDKNSTKEFLKGKNLEEGDLGPTYGFNFRHYGAEYKTCKDDYTNKGFDQIKYVIDSIKKCPDSRRLIIDLWNPLTMDKCAIPPCLFIYQFYVYENKLSCCTYQRSADMGLGVPFNIASASLLTYIIVKETNLEPYELIYNIGDAHVYSNHIDELQKQIKRSVRKFPKIKINNEKDIELQNYFPHLPIKLEMVV